MAHANKIKREQKGLKKGKKMEAVKPLTLSDFGIVKSTDGSTPTLMK